MIANKVLLLAFFMTVIPYAAMASDDPIEVRIKNHKFYPDRITVKAGTRFKLRLINEDSTSEEFESNTMIVEKFLGPKRKMTITLGPLKPGTYEYFGELNPSTAQGILTAE